MRPTVFSAERAAPVSAQKPHRHLAAIEAVVGHGGRYHRFPQAEGAFVPYQLLPSGLLLHARRDCQLSMSRACGRSTRSGSPVTVPWWPLRRTASLSPRPAISLPNWRTSSTCQSKNPCCSWSRKAGSPARPSPAYICTAPTISRTRQQQLRARQALLDQAAAASAGIPSGHVSDELRAAIVLFASLLDEQQRRLYAGLESLQLGGDRQIAELLGLDPHTVAKGRRQLLAQDVEAGRVRAVGGGRKPVEKKRPR